MKVTKCDMCGKEIKGVLYIRNTVNKSEETVRFKVVFKTIDCNKWVTSDICLKCAKSGIFEYIPE